MKRMLAAGYPRIFQICKAFRNGERGRHHLPEMTLLEWYRPGSDYFDLMDDCEEMILSVLGNLGLKEKIAFQGQALDLSRPWERMTLREAFKRFASTSIEEAVESGRFEELLVELVEPGLNPLKPTFLYDYPASLAALSRLKEAQPEVAERFELYIGGIEIANAFSELTDPIEQEKRFDREIRRRGSLGKDVYPMPRGFLRALSTMPESAGIALGLDRLVMILADRGRIDEVVAFTPEEL
jgi:lysyl-tRNA synthetase class 2